MAGGEVAWEHHLLSILIFLPLAGAAALLLLRADDHLWIRRVALAAAIGELGVSLKLLRWFDAATPGYQLEELRNWISQPLIHYHGWNGRHQPVFDFADHRADPDRDFGVMEIHQRAREGIFRLPAGA